MLPVRRGRAPGRALALWLFAAGAGSRDVLAAAFNEFKGDTAGQRLGGDQADLDSVAQPVDLAPTAADQSVPGLVVFVEVVRQRGDRDDAIGAGLVERHE